MKEKKNTHRAESISSLSWDNNREKSELSETPAFDRGALILKSQDLGEKHSPEGATRPLRSAVMLSTCMSRSSLRALPATSPRLTLASCASHMVLLLFPLAGDPNEAHLTGTACHVQRQTSAGQAKLLTHSSICDPVKMLVNLTVSSVT